MKRINNYILFLVCWTSLCASGQRQQGVPFQQSHELHPNIGSHNYVMTRTYTEADDSKCRINIDYYDGLGRPSGTVAVGASPLRKDIISRQDYDTLGRPSCEWLPCVSDYSNGKHLTSDEFELLSFDIYGGDSRTYSMTIYENSPLNRILEQYGPGSDWYDNEKSVVTTHKINISGDAIMNCKYYYIDGTRLDPILKLDGNYETGQLYVREVKDEDGNMSYEFKDKLGQLILTRQMEGNITYDTYYVYDNFGKLCFVLPPRLDDEGITQSKLDELAYQYKYDGRSRCIGKKIPGCDWIYYIYDKADRLIFSQDGNCRRAGEWAFSIPDIFGKKCFSGVCNNIFDVFSAPLDSVVVKADRCSSSTIGSGDYKGYKLTGVTLNSPTVHQVNYYNDYSFLGQNGIPSETDAKVCYDADAESEGYGKRYEASAQGLLTGMLTAQLSSSDTSTPTAYCYSVMYYDNHGRVIQTKSSNHLLGGTDMNYVAYNFTGQITQQKRVHSATGKMAQTELYAYTYDHAGRLLTATHQLNDGVKVTLSDNEYDELGRIKNNKYNGQPNLQTDYTYNVRSWVKSINSALFTQTLHYTDGFGVPCYNGNISGMMWKQSSDVESRGYNFEYDDLNRLKNAVYGEGSDLRIHPNRFNEQVTGYDKMGNILGLLRYGETESGDYGLLDNLHLSYDGNQLRSVYDNATLTASSTGMEFVDRADSLVEYAYDANGNLTKDLNKKITDIQYNVLNLPCRIAFENGNSISYVYDANGTKLHTTHIIGNDTTITDYCGNVVYENGTPNMLLTEAGFVSLNDSKYHYYLTDHQGNNRVVADEDGIVDEVNDYYPFGALMGSSVGSVQPYKYSGKELDRKGGLNWYDYGARHYNATLGRWPTKDPMAEKYYSISPYAYCLNNPIKFIDPTGMVIETPPGFWASFGKGFSQPFVNFGNAVSHPVETVTGIVNTVKNATPLEIGLSLGEQILRSSISPVSSAFSQLDVVQAIEYDKANGTMSSAEVIGNQWGNITFDAATIAVGAGVGKVTGTLGKASSGVGKVKGLGNPFKNMTLDQVRTSMDKHVGTGKLKVVVIDNKTGLNKTYYNNKSGYSYNLDEGRLTRVGRQQVIEGPHIDVNYPKPKPKNIQKKKLPVNN